MENKQEANQQELIPLKPKIQSIKCPNCGSVELAFVTEYHRAIGTKIISSILFLIATGTLLSVLISLITKTKTEADGVFIAIIFICYIMALFCRCIAYITESKTHVQAICRDCGNIWLLN